MMNSVLFTVLLSTCLCGLTTVTSFLNAPPLVHHLPAIPNHGESSHLPSPSYSCSSSSSTLMMAGFGGGGSSSSKKNKKKKGGVDGPKVLKLKAKSQWDRYNDLKQCQKVLVGVRIKSEADDTGNDWMEVGRVKSENDEFSEVAVVRQRALIAEHSKRIYPVQIPANAIVEWGYLPLSCDDNDEEENTQQEWILVDKSKGDDAPTGIEKKIGFEGISDKATGFYCYYKEGRIVEREVIKGKNLLSER